MRLRPYKKCDAESIVKWLGDERAFLMWSAGRYGKFPITAEDINAHYEQYAYSDGFFPFTAFDEDGVLGHLIMRFTDAEKQKLRFGFIIVDSARRGEGCGKKMLEKALDYSFGILEVKEVTIGVFEQNISARKCYESVGFKETGESELMEIMGEQWKCIELKEENFNGKN